jgi:hypothetical protein
MTEAEWLACTDPEPMLAFLRGKAGDRKLRLYACGCCRLVWPLLTDPRSRAAVEAAESYADGLIGVGELRAAYRAAHAAARAAQRRRGQASGSTLPPEAQAEHAAKAAVRAATQKDALLASAEVWLASGRTWDERGPVRRSEASLLRCLFGNPFRPVSADPAWLAWNGGTIPRLAGTIYADRAFGRLPVLADALEEAGCTNAEVLAHCRGPGPHAKGCWLLDLVSGRQ